MQEPLQILREYWGHAEFRPLQAEIVASILAGRDTLALLPTGGGKSVCFQVPGMALPGLTIVISPLIALMKDQVENLNSRHIPATYINSSLSWREIDRKLQMAMDGRYKFLYLAPERIENEMFRVRLPKMDISLVAVDEAHCISQWGYDFRPAYLRIATLREALPKVPVAAFTATAPTRVREDIVDKLQLRTPQIFTQSFRRKNLSYRVLASENVSDRIVQLLRDVKGAGIVYARTRKRVQALADLLKREGIPSAAYHGGMDTSARNKVQTAWIRNELRVIVATNAFGMGIDKPDVRFVLHLNLPADLESYYQEAGRAGRDGLSSVAAAFSNLQDQAELEQWVGERYPTWEELNGHYEILCNYYGLPNTGIPDELYPFDPGAIAKSFSAHPIRFYNSVQVLDQTGVVTLNEREDDYGYLMVTVRPEDILAYKSRYPEKAYLLDHILRSLGGEAYTDEMRFLPSNWARRLDLPEAELNRLLGQLNERGIVAYRPPAAHPTLKFLSPRHKLGKEELEWDRYEFLRRQAKDRLAKLLAYATVPGKECRSLILERYFGEEGTTPCGVCDWCMAQTAGPLDSAKENRIRAAILAGIGEGEVELRGLLDALPEGTMAQRLEVVRRMMDAGILRRVGALRVRRN